MVTTRSPKPELDLCSAHLFRCWALASPCGFGGGLGGRITTGVACCAGRPSEAATECASPFFSSGVVAAAIATGFLEFDLALNMATVDETLW